MRTAARIRFRPEPRLIAGRRRGATGRSRRAWFSDSMNKRNEMKHPPRFQRALSILILLVGPVLAGSLEAQEARTPQGRPGSELRRWNCTGNPDDLPRGDPSRGEIPLEGAAPSWNAFHLFTSDTWRLHCIGAGHLTRDFGSPQVIVLDEKGRCIILQEDSGKWSAGVAIEDGSAMSGWARGDLDPRVEGEELYVAGGRGNLYRVTQHGRNSYTSEIVASAPGRRFSKLVLGEIDPSHPGNEMLALTNNGPVFDIRPEPGTKSGFVIEQIGDLGSRTRDVVLLPGVGSKPPRVAALQATGEVALLVRTPQGFDHTPMCQEPMSIARMARRPRRSGPEVLYVARVDGLILRFSERDDGVWTREPIYAGPNGPRGLAAGHFDADRNVETVAVFGYSKRLQLLSRRPGGRWRVETLFTDTGGGHWLTAAELDGRNSTDELVGGGFSYHVFLLCRVPGYGLGDVAVDPDGGLPRYAMHGAASRRGEEAPVAHGGTTPSAHAKAGSPASPLAGTRPAHALLACDFEADAPGAVPAGWSVGETNGKGTTATWRVVQADGAADGRKFLRIVESRNRGHTFNLLLTDRVYPADVRLDVAIRAETGKEDRGGGLVWRARDANNYYVARWNPLELNLRVYKVEKGVRSMFETCRVQCDPTVWHRVSIVMRGTKGSVLFDGARCLTFEDATFTGPGRVGLWTKADAASSFDGFVARPAGN